MNELKAIDMWPNPHFPPGAFTVSWGKHSTPPMRYDEDGAVVHAEVKEMLRQADKGAK